MRIGQVAAQAAVNIQTLRYYERRGLMPAVERRESGYREYDPTAVDRVRFIKHAQALGFTLDEIGDLLALRVSADTACAQVEARAELAIARIDEKVDHLTRMRAVLGRLATACQRQDLTGDCPILHALEDAPCL
ncbi:MAG TPA: heavy metal-responsive transcriptional regulator [Gemmatimonadaceae bacterium]|jgi:Hg(II)-responsive transcriptional regulator|nr:heavy metal-responsive transcriptional regulator [Gemmatimonadaceae bacterium]